MVYSSLDIIFLQILSELLDKAERVPGSQIRVDLEKDSAFVDIELEGYKYTILLKIRKINESNFKG
jgi:hypothetical protein